MGLFTDPIDGEKHSHKPYASPSVPAADLSNFGVVFSTAVFSQLYQHSVPGLMEPLPPVKQHRLRAVFAAALGTTLTIYLCLGAACAFYFGTGAKDSINLNWKGYSWGFTHGAVPLWAKAINHLIVLFPAVNTHCVFPLIAVTLGNNMAASIRPCWERRLWTLFWRLM